MVRRWLDFVGHGRLFGKGRIKRRREEGKEKKELIVRSFRYYGDYCFVEGAS